MTGEYLADRLERVRGALVTAVAIAAVLMLGGGIACKSRRWSDISNGSSMSWTDGVKPWAVWSFLGALVILGLCYIGLRYKWWHLCGGGSAVVFGKAGTMAAAYRTRYESADWSSMYDHQSIALGLYLVPVVAVVGVVCAVLLIFISAMMDVRDRGVPRAQPGA